MKKIGISMLLALAFTILISIFNVGTVTTVYACSTLAECREIRRTTRDTITEILEEEGEVSEDISAIQTQIAELRGEILGLEADINDLETEVADLESRILTLAEEMEERVEIIEEIDEHIDYLLIEVAERVRRNQRFNNTHTFLTLLSDADNLSDFIRMTRTFTRFATSDAQYLDELSDLIEFQRELMIALEDQTEEFQATRDEHREHADALAIEQENLEIAQGALLANEQQLQDRLNALYADRLTEEEIYAAAAAAEEILARTPPPPLTTPSNSNPTANTPLPQAPNESGLAHPLPGARVSSEFGLRWGVHHGGIDLEIFTQPRSPILAAAAGTVTVSEWHNSMGWYVIITHNINGQRIDTLYAHLRYQPMVSVGDSVFQGQQIGIKGSTGFSTGPHLHFEVHIGAFSWNGGVNPRLWVQF